MLLDFSYLLVECKYNHNLPKLTKNMSYIYYILAILLAYYYIWAIYITKSRSLTRSTSCVLLWTSVRRVLLENNPVIPETERQRRWRNCRWTAQSAWHLQFCIDRFYSHRFNSFYLLGALLLLQLGIPVAFFASRALRWLMFNLVHQDPQVLFFKDAFLSISPQIVLFIVACIRVKWI